MTLDPRDTSSSKAALLGFGGSDGARKAREEKARDGRRGRDWVDQRGGRDRDRDREQRPRPQERRAPKSQYADEPRPREDLERW